MECLIKAQARQVSICYKRKDFKDDKGYRIIRKRDVVGEFSDASRRRMLRYLESSKAGYFSIGTLTYPHMQDQEIARQYRKHFRAFAERVKRLFAHDQNFSLFWFLEFQKNGRPHFHFYTNRFIEYGWIAAAWYQIVDSGCAEHAKAGTSIEGFRSGKAGLLKYAAKYSAKRDQKTMPDVYKNSKSTGRWWGIVGNRSVVSAAIRVDDTEYFAFDIFDLHRACEKLCKKLVFDDYGVKVFHFDSESSFFEVFRMIKRANKVLFKAEQICATELYRKRRG